MRPVRQINLWHRFNPTTHSETPSPSRKKSPRSSKNGKSTPTLFLPLRTSITLSATSVGIKVWLTWIRVVEWRSRWRFVIHPSTLNSTSYWHPLRSSEHDQLDEIHHVGRQFNGLPSPCLGPDARSDCVSDQVYLVSPSPSFKSSFLAHTETCLSSSFEIILTGTTSSTDLKTLPTHYWTRWAWVIRLIFALWWATCLSFVKRR